MMKKYLLLCTIVLTSLIIVQSCNPTTKSGGDNWSHVRAALHAEADSLIKDDSSKNKWCDCIINQFEKSYPEGEKSVPRDSLGAISHRYSPGCSAQISVRLKGWTPLIESTMKVALLRLPFVQKLREEYRDAFCECYIQELKKRYPDGVNEQLSDQTNEEITSKCMKMLVDKKYKK